MKQRAENYVDTISKCILIPDERYSLTCPSEKHEVIPEVNRMMISNFVLVLNLAIDQAKVLRATFLFSSWAADWYMLSKQCCDLQL